MENRPNRMLRDIEENRLALGLGVGMVPGAGIPLVAAAAGYSWLFVDLEHSPLSLKDVAELSMSSIGFELGCLVRLCRDSIHEGCRALDNGASGVVMPRVNDAADARRLVELCKYKPVGNRSWGGPSPHLGFPAKPSEALMSRANRETWAVAMIESISGVANVEEIAATPGLDAVFIGAVDLSTEMGYHGDVTHPDVVADIGRCAEIIAAHGLKVGLGGVFGNKAFSLYSDFHFDFFLAGIDYRLLNDAIRQRAVDTVDGLAAAKV